jgi:hypothetical protein
VRPYLEKPFMKKKSLVEWLKMSSSPSATIKKKKKKRSPLQIIPKLHAPLPGTNHWGRNP